MSDVGRLNDVCGRMWCRDTQSKKQGKVDMGARAWTVTSGRRCVEMLLRESECITRIQTEDVCEGRPAWRRSTLVGAVGPA